MAFRIITSRRAKKEIENAINYYALYSNLAPINFSAVLKDAFDTLRAYPFFAVRYKNVRTLKLKGFPYSLYFIVNDKNNTVSILSCFHNKQSPYKRPRFQ
ncbi:MAG TPA: type II toxin-antitoxin system RelE/ParE family toxin [Dysgonamonadaceae bacterium]|nr:type II toxin-antitoxin system RelE/ParE family toxin [Dysgonamonadaceae bacterium]